MTIHQRIKELRKAAKLSQKALAERVGVSYQTIQQWEGGKTAPERKRVDDVAKALGTTPQYLLVGVEVEPILPIYDRNKYVIPHDDKVNLADLSNVTIPLRYSVDATNFRRVYVVGRAQGGMPERLWTDGDYPVGATDQYAELATTDPHAFLCPVVGTSMVPKFNPGDFAFVEPETEIEIEDDVLVRLATGETMIKRLVSKRGGIQLASYNEPGHLLFQPEEISWMYYVAHYVPARKIKTRM